MPIETKTLLLLTSAELGEGEPDLGAKLMRAFLGCVLEGERLPGRIICLNSGVFLTTAGSPVAEHLKALAAAGVAISSCGTCLEYYGRKDKLIVGAVGDMRQTVAALQTAERVIRP